MSNFLSTNQIEQHLSKGLNALASGHFFDAHEDWEIPWREMQGPPRVFWQAMIQLSVGAYHYENKQMRGCRNLWRKGLIRSENLLIYEEQPPRDWVWELLSVFQQCQDALAREEDPLPLVLHFARNTVGNSWLTYY